MFRSLIDARQRLAATLAGPDTLESPLAPAEIERILGHLAPQLWIAPGEGLPDRAGGTRFGGAPDLPPGLDWPVRRVPPDLAARAQQLGAHHDWILRHIERDLPCEFL